MRKWAELVKFSHTLFALPFALAAMVVAARDNRGWPGWRKFGLILACMVCARTCAMSFNRLADRKFDALNPRTAARHLPAGTLSVGSVKMFAAMSSAAFVAANLIFLPNWLPLALSVPMLLFLLGYSYTKRFTSLAH